MLKTKDISRSLIAAELGLVAGVSLMAAAAAPVLAHEEHGHPARIHEGTCDALGRVAFSLNGVGGSVDLDGAPVATPTAINPTTTYQVVVSETTIDAPLDEVMAADHAVMLYESDEAMDAIACGNVGGALAGDMLITGLAEANMPGHVGFALFQPTGEQTEVTIIVGHAMAPISASSGVSEARDEEAEDADHEHEDEDADHEEGEDHADAATPEA